MNNVSIFKSELPAYATLSEIINKTVREETGESSLSFKPCTEHQRATHGLDPVRPIVKIEGGFIINFSFSEKIIPPKIITQETKKRLDKIAEEYGGDIDKKMRHEALEYVLGRLVPAYVAEISHLKLYYHTRSQTILVTSNKPYYSGLMLGTLRKLLGSIKTETLHVDGISNSLSQNITRSLRNDEGLGFKGFSFGENIKLEQLEGGSVSFTKDYETDILLNLLDMGYVVKSLQLYRDGLTFTLKEDLSISGIRLDKVLIEDIERELDGEVEAEHFAESVRNLAEQTEVELLVGISDDLVEYFSKMAKTLAEENTPETTTEDN